MSENTTNEEFKKQARDYILGEAGAIPIYRKREKRLSTPRFRLRLVEYLLEAGKPISHYKMAFDFKKTSSSLRRHLKVLSEAGIVCDRVYVRGKRVVHWTVCPVCPLRNICEDKESTVWKNT